MAQLLALFIGALHFLSNLTRPLLDCLLSALFRLIRGRQTSLPPITDRLLMLSATQLADSIRKRKVSCKEAMLAYHARLLQVNPLLNAVVDNRFEEAMAEAEQCDLMLTTDTRTEEQLARDKPLLGVPFTCKEAIAIEGLYNTSALVERKGVRATEDAEVVRLYRRAGAIPFASTNIPELCMWSESANRLYGITNNPHDLHRTCGGSSGGEGALIAAAGSVLGIGNDLGGSIRIPACLNGIFGHKPTPGVVSNKGMYPPITGKVDEMWSAGPMSRHAQDLATVMAAIAGDDRKLRLDEKVDLKDVKFFYMEDDGSKYAAVMSDIKNAVKKAADHLEQQVGATVQKVHIAELSHGGFPLWQAKYAQCSPPAMVTQMADFKGEVWPLWELLKWTVGLSEHTLPAIYFAISEDRSKDETHHMMIQKLKELEAKMTDMLSGNAVFLYPTQPEVAHHHHMGVIKFAHVGYTAVFNALGFPATQVPAGLSGGLPIGIQAVAAPYNDRLTLVTAVQLEKLFGGWTSPGPVLLKDH